MRLNWKFFLFCDKIILYICINNTNVCFPCYPYSFFFLSLPLFFLLFLSNIFSCKHQRKTQVPVAGTRKAIHLTSQILLALYWDEKSMSMLKKDSRWHYRSLSVKVILLCLDFKFFFETICVRCQVAVTIIILRYLKSGLVLFSMSIYFTYLELSFVSSVLAVLLLIQHK